MADAAFEILLFLAYLSAALVSVVIAVYAISVSFLGRETSRSIWALKKRQRDLESRIKESERKIDIKEMETEIEKYRHEEADLKGKLLFLSMKGAVLPPLAVLFLALFFSLYGMYQYQWYPQLSFYIVGALAANGMGIVALIKVLRTVEWAALRIPLPKLEVSFVSWLKEEKMAAKERKELQLWISNRGDVMAEDVEVLVSFPPDFKVVPKKLVYYVIEQSKGSELAGYNTAIFDLDRVHVNLNVKSPRIDVEAPEKPQRYRIPVCVYERNTGESEHELFIKVE